MYVDLDNGVMHLRFELCIQADQEEIGADGLGNPHSNTVPACQLRYLQNLANCLYTSSESASTQPCPWWFDTFCVPLKGMAPRQRRMAI